MYSYYIFEVYKIYCQYPKVIVLSDTRKCVNEITTGEK